jgi:hypothetical protein
MKPGNAAQLGKANAAFTTADEAWALLINPAKEPGNKKSKEETGLLSDLLDRFNISSM